MSNIIMCDPKGGDPYEIARKLLDNTLTEYIDDTVTLLRARAFDSLSNLVTVQVHNVEESGSNIINGAGVTKLAFPNLKKSTLNPNGTLGGYFLTSTKVLELDLGPYISTLAANSLNGDAKLATLILRSPSVVTLAATNAIGGTPFKSGGTGGTIYIPKALYDHLGDGTADDYKAETNWSIVNGYGTITWAQIEGSIYETQYADGTPIPSE